MWHILAFYKKGIKGKQLRLALEKLFSLHIVELSSPASYCHFITLQHIGSKTRTATSCLQWAGAVRELSGLLSVSVWLEIRLKTVGCYQQVNFFFLLFNFWLSPAMSMQVKLKHLTQKGKCLFNPFKYSWICLEQQAQICMQYYCFRDNFKGKTIETGKKTSKNNPWSVFYIFNICYAETRVVVRLHKHYVPRLNT